MLIFQGLSGPNWFSPLDKAFNTVYTIEYANDHYILWQATEELDVVARILLLLLAFFDL